MTENSAYENKKSSLSDSVRDSLTAVQDEKKEKRVRRVRHSRVDTEKVVKIILGVFLSAFILISSALIYIFSTRDVVWHEDMDPVFYIEDSTLFCADLSQPLKIPLAVASQISSEKIAAPDSFCLSEDKKHLIFTSGFSELDEYYTLTYDLIYFNLENPEAGCVTLAENVISYSVNAAFDTLTYVRAPEGTSLLYQSDFNGNEELVSKGYGSYKVCLQSNELLYTDSEGSVFLKAYGEKPLLLSREAAPVYARDDFSEFILCSQSGELFRITDDKKKTLIAENAAYESYRKGKFPAFSDGTGFYLTASESYPIADFIVDDMLSADKKMRYTDDGYEAKLRRDALRASLRQQGENAVTFSLWDIFYYDGENSHLVAENAAAFFNAETFNGSDTVSDILLYTRLEGIEKIKIRMSELDEESAYLLSMGDLMQLHHKDSDIYLAVKDTGSKRLPFAPYRVGHCAYQPEGNSLILSVYSGPSDTEDEALYTLYRSSTDVYGASDFTLLDKNVLNGKVYSLSDGRETYLKSDAESKGSFSLYCDREKLCDGISTSVFYEKNTRSLLLPLKNNTEGGFACTLYSDAGAQSLLFEEGAVSLTPHITDRGDLLFCNGPRIYRVKNDSLRQWKSNCELLLFPHSPQAFSASTSTDFLLLDEA